MLYEILNTTYVNKIGIESLTVAALVLALTVLLGRIIIPVLRAKKLNQPINSYVAEHAGKSGTPTMGGICFIIASLVVMLVWILLGILFWFRIKNNFLYGKWCGISVEQILITKMAQTVTTQTDSTPQ